ncbi:hypothetical protein QVE09_09370 [Paenibacillus sp. ClWae2A]|uniref:hypothetical protein n=1 Tax=Paenibacillus sp. ClWae2A TaxID=3057177 RepID=UPI0028F62A5F|nr:hypothetical protein [Paenibacillus sp. ClWae2A]MDT9719110.1 hypothetical protein [Paenibacillus sp. ClWae2A]
MKKTGLALSAILAASTLLAGVSTADPVIQDTTTSPESIILDLNSQVVDWEVTRLSPEEFLVKYAEATGKSYSEVRKEFPEKTSSKSETRANGINQTYDAEYAAIIDLGAGVKAKAGILVQLQEVQFGGSIGRVFKKVYPDTGYLAPYSGGTFTIVKNYVKGTLQSETRLQISFSGYSETAVTNEKSTGLNLGVDKIIQAGWNLSSTSGKTTYYRKNFNSSGFVSPN